MDFARIVDSLAPVRLACSWDNVGFQIGYRGAAAGHVLCALEVTPQVIQEARAIGADVILVHHPVIFSPLKTLTDETPSGLMALELVRYGISLVAAHTNLDKSPSGTNRALAETLGLSSLEFLEPEPEPSGPPLWGMGYLGNLPNPLLLGSLALMVQDRIGSPAISIVGDKNVLVGRVAIMTGSGSSVIHTLKRGVADCLITGELSHHAALDARILGIPVVCAGHFSSEVIGMSWFSKVLAGHEEINAHGVRITISRVQTEPREYLHGEQ